MLNLEDITKLAASDNLTVRAKGTKTFFWYARREEIDVLPPYPAAPLTFAESVTITGDITFLPTYSFKRVYTTMQKAELSSELQGDVDSKSFATTFSFSTPSNDPTLLGFLEAIKNDELVIIVPELCGNNRLLGGECQVTMMDSATITSGTDQASFNGLTATIMSVGKIPAIYEGIISETAAP